MFEFIRPARFCTFPNLLPRRQRFKVPMSLSHLQRLIDYAFPFLVISNLRITSQREIFAKGMTFETVICQYATEVRMTFKEDTIEIPGLSFIPIGASEHWDGTGDCVCLPSICFDSDSSCVFDTQQAIHNLESFVSVGIIRAADIHAAFELTLGMIPQESEHRGDAGRGNIESELVFKNRELLNEFRETLHEIGAVCV